jgi:hypothetical protein
MYLSNDSYNQVDQVEIPLPKSRKHFSKLSVRNYLYNHDIMFSDLEDVVIAAFHIATSNAQYAFNAHRVFSLTFFRGFHHPLIADIVGANTSEVIKEHYPELRVMYKIEEDHEYEGTFRIEMKIDFENQ